MLFVFIGIPLIPYDMPHNSIECGGADARSSNFILLLSLFLESYMIRITSREKQHIRKDEQLDDTLFIVDIVKLTSTGLNFNDLLTKQQTHCAVLRKNYY